jgi:putative MATE family efflux protein
MDSVFRLLGASPEVLPLIRDYMGIWFAGYPLVLVPMAAMGAIRATGDTRAQSSIITVAALVNLILDPLLIFGLLGFPRLEIQGAAIATVLARLVSLAIGAWYMLIKNRMLATNVPARAELADSWRRVLHVGLPAAGTNVIIPISAGVIVALLARFGEHAVAGFGAAIRVEAVMLVVFFAMSSVIGPFVGQNLGARKPWRILRAIRLSAAFCIGLGIVIALVLGMFAPELSRLFSDDDVVVTVSTLYLRIVPASYGLAGIVMLVNAAFNGLGKPFPAMVVSVTRTLVLYVPLAFVASYFFGVAGIFAATCFSNMVCGIIAFLWFQKICRS